MIVSTLENNIPLEEDMIRITNDTYSSLRLSSQ